MNAIEQYFHVVLFTIVLTDTFAILLICSTVKRELYSLSDTRLSSATKRLDWKKK